MNVRVAWQLAIVVAWGGLLSYGAPPLETILQQVAQNQERAEALRAQYVYHQNVKIGARLSNGKLSREEAVEYVVTPTATGVQKEQTKFDGRYEDKGKLVAYAKAGEANPNRKMDVDADLIKSLREDWTNHKKSRDGIDPELFPLTTGEQGKYVFSFKGEETWRGRPVYRLAFVPKKGIEDGAMWAGEALVTRDECQPVLVTTNLGMKIPMAVKTLLGTNFQGVGFNVQYAPFEEGVWFPVSLGTEFRARVVFFYKRTFTLSLVNSEFKRTKVTADIKYEEVK